MLTHILLEDINWLGALVAAVAAFIAGALWYSPLLFAGPWQRALGLSDEALRSGGVGRIFFLAFVAMFIAAAGFSLVLGKGAGLGMGFHWGLGVGLLFVATSLAIHNAFERRPLYYWAINAGFNLIQFLIYGLVLGAWPVD